MIGNRESGIGSRTVAIGLVLALSSVAGAQRPGAKDFWGSLGDTTLTRLVGEAVRNNHDVEAVRARVSGARAARVGALLDLTPSVSAVSGYSRQRVASSA